MMLERVGYRVLLTCDGCEAVETFKAHHETVDLVLLDMTMPRMSGEEALEQIRGINPNVKVIISSGYNEQEAINRFSGQELAAFIQKPYRPRDLIRLIGRTLDPASPQ